MNDFLKQAYEAGCAMALKEAGVGNFLRNPNAVVPVLGGGLGASVGVASADSPGEALGRGLAGGAIGAGAGYGLSRLAGLSGRTIHEAKSPWGQFGWGLSDIVSSF